MTAAEFFSEVNQYSEVITGASGADQVLPDPTIVFVDIRDEEGEGEAPKPETEWHLTKPIEARADKSTVESLLRSLTGLKKERSVTGTDRADAGLDQPRARHRGSASGGSWRVLITRRRLVGL